jgi:hypothetical protein
MRVVWSAEVSLLAVALDKSFECVCKGEKRTVLSCMIQSSLMGLSRFGLWVSIEVSQKVDGLGHSCTTCR